MTAEEIDRRSSSGRDDRLALAGVALACAVILISAVVAVTALLRGEDTRNIIERDPCLIDPGGHLCQQTQREADRHQTLRDACIRPRIFMTDSAYDELTRCPDRRRTDGSATNPGAGGEPAADTAGRSGAGGPSDRGGGNGGGGGAGGEPGPPDAPPQAPPAPAPPPSPSPPEPPAAPPSPSPSPAPTLGDQVAAAADDAVDAATGAACNLTTPLGVCIR